MVHGKVLVERFGDGWVTFVVPGSVGPKEENCVSGRRGHLLAVSSTSHLSEETWGPDPLGKVGAPLGSPVTTTGPRRHPVSIVCLLPTPPSSGGSSSRTDICYSTAERFRPPLSRGGDESRTTDASGPWFPDPVGTGPRLRRGERRVQS